MNTWPKNLRRSEGGGVIRWFRDGKLVLEVTTSAYYRDAHIHSKGCTCDALIHDANFQAKLKEATDPQ